MPIKEVFKEAAEVVVHAGMVTALFFYFLAKGNKDDGEPLPIDNKPVGGDHCCVHAVLQTPAKSGKQAANKACDKKSPSAIKVAAKKSKDTAELLSKAAATTTASCETAPPTVVHNKATIVVRQKGDPKVIVSPPPPTNLGNSTVQIQIRPSSRAQAQVSPKPREEKTAEIVWPVKKPDQPHPHQSTEPQPEPEPKKAYVKRDISAKPTSNKPPTGPRESTEILDCLTRPVAVGEIRKAWPPPSNATGVEVVRENVAAKLLMTEREEDLVQQQEIATAECVALENEKESTEGRGTMTHSDVSSNAGSDDNGVSTEKVCEAEGILEQAAEEAKRQAEISEREKKLFNGAPRVIPRRSESAHGTRDTSRERCRELATALHAPGAPTSKGVELFLRRRERAEQFVVDETTAAQRLPPRPPSVPPTVGRKTSAQMTPFTQAQQQQAQQTQPEHEQQQQQQQQPMWRDNRPLPPDDEFQKAVLENWKEKAAVKIVKSPWEAALNDPSGNPRSAFYNEFKPEENIRHTAPSPAPLEEIKKSRTTPVPLRPSDFILGYYEPEKQQPEDKPPAHEIQQRPYQAPTPPDHDYKQRPHQAPTPPVHDYQQHPYKAPTPPVHDYQQHPYQAPTPPPPAYVMSATLPPKPQHTIEDVMSRSVESCFENTQTQEPVLHSPARVNNPRTPRWAASTPKPYVAYASQTPEPPAPAAPSPAQHHPANNYVSGRHSAMIFSHTNRPYTPLYLSTRSYTSAYDNEIAQYNGAYNGRYEDYDQFGVKDNNVPKGWNDPYYNMSQSACAYNSNNYDTDMEAETSPNYYCAQGSPASSSGTQAKRYASFANAPGVNSLPRSWKSFAEAYKHNFE